MSATGNGLAVNTAGLTRHYGQVVAVDALDLQVPQGVVFGFLGPNGAGKSTTIRMLTGVLPPTRGTAQVCGRDVVAEPLEVKRCIGVVPEAPGLYERLTAREQVEFAGRLYGLSPEEVAARRDPLLEVLGLTDDENRMIVDYSQGMRKKVAIACALIHAPRVLFLDEPFAGIDPVATSTIKRLLRAMVEEREATVFFSTHVMELAQAFCDRVGIIHRGRLVAEGTIPDLRERAGLGADAPLEEVFVRLVGGDVPAEAGLGWLRGAGQEDAGGAP